MFPSLEYGTPKKITTFSKKNVKTFSFYDQKIENRSFNNQ